MGTLTKSGGNLFPSFPRLFDDFLTRDLFQWPSNFRNTDTTLPAVNVRETNDSFELEVAAPGMTKKDFTVEMENDTLVISAEREVKEEDSDPEGKYTRREFSYRSFKRYFNLPERMVKSDKIEANYHDGILHIVIPKTETAKSKPRRVIEVS